MGNLLEETEVGSLAAPKRPIISVPEEASVQTALKVMISNNVVALPVSAPPGKWLGAGASVIIDEDKQYIGMVSMVDVAMHLAASRCAPDALGTRVFELIGFSPEGLSMWVYDPHTRLADVLEPLSKGVHRILVRSPAPGLTKKGAHEGAEAGAGPGPAGPTLVPGHSGTGHRYYFVSQTDVVGFLLEHVDDLGPVVSRTLVELSLVDPLFPPLAVSESETVLSVLRLMKTAPGVRAVAVVAANSGDEDPETSEAGAASTSTVGLGGRDMETSGVEAAHHAPEVGPTEADVDAPVPSIEALWEQNHHPAAWQRGGRLLGTLSVSDLRGLDAQRLGELRSLKVGEFLAVAQGGDSKCARPPVACHPSTPLSLAMALAITNRVHRVWVTTEDDSLVGVVSLSDIIASVRRGYARAT